MRPGGSRRPHGDLDDVAVAERWFRHHGLPWFVEEEAARVRRLVAPRHLARVAGTGLTVGALVGAPTGWWTRTPSVGLAVAMTVAGLVVLGWASRRLDVGQVARWAVSRTVRQLGLLVPLATRALPLLLLFTVTLFINTEVWMVASSLSPGVLWITVLLFAALAAFFLLARLPEEVQAVVDRVAGDGLSPALEGTPFRGRAAELAAGAPGVSLSRLQRANLMIVLLVVQAGQVLLLALAVWLFFVVFGAVAVRPEIVEAWIGSAPRAFGPPGAAVSLELLQVAVFLAAFSGLYFTVYAVTDETYRRQFFTQITTELEHAVGVRAAYLAIRQRAGR